MSKELIDFQKVNKGFGEIKVIKNLDLKIYDNEIFGFIGTSGAGKTTLLRVLMGFYKVDSGKVIYKGHNITKKPHIIRNIVGFCTQENSFYPELTIRENLQYFGRLYCLNPKKLTKQVKYLLNLVDLERHQNTLSGRISGGMKRRLDFAITLIHDPEILILDEPTTGLDPIIRDNIWNLITKINKSGKTIIVTSHLLDFIEKHCNRIGILNFGRMIKVNTPNKLSSLYPKEKTFGKVFEKIVKNDKLVIK